MSQTDPIADMLTRVRNANKALHAQVEMPSSSQKVDLARVLNDEGYIAGFTVVRDGSFDKLVIELKYTDGRRRVISQVKRVSKPGRRIYAKKDNLPRVLGGLGTAVISTSRGLMTAREAQRLGVGGEVVCFVW
jgi:small subunit ribosomal protein S8